MIEICHTLANCDKIASWLEEIIRPRLKADVSNYAKGRLRAWLRVEPPLSSTQPTRPGVEVDDKVWDRLAELINWPFDFCLITYSGDEKAVGIAPHRDASYANYTARSLHISGECRFDFWEKRNATKDTPPSHELILQPGQVTEFNCKHLHAATPGTKRWNINFWRKKPLDK